MSLTISKEVGKEMAASLLARFSATVQDETGLKASTTVHLLIDPAQTATQIDTALQAWVTALDAILDGKVIRASATLLPSNIGTVKSAPASGSEIQEVASFDFPVHGTGNHWASDTPAYSETLETADHKPDLTNATVQAYYQLISTAPVLGGFYSTPDGVQLDALAYAFLPTRKHRRKQNAMSMARP